MKPHHVNSEMVWRSEGYRHGRKREGGHREWWWRSRWLQAGGLHPICNDILAGEWIEMGKSDWRCQMDHVELSTLPATDSSVIDVWSFDVVIDLNDVNVVCRGKVNNCCCHFPYLHNQIHWYSHYRGRVCLTPLWKSLSPKYLPSPFLLYMSLGSYAHAKEILIWNNWMMMMTCVCLWLISIRSL